MTQLLLTIFLFHLSNIVFIHCEDPCAEGEHRIIDDFRRNVDYVPKRADEALCDVYLRSGWHRFLINGSNAILPTACTEVFRCGTQAPIWLKLRSGMPLPGQEKRGEACASWRLPRKDIDCCMAKTSAIVKNCGNFYIYRISAARGCNLAYCTTIQEKSCEEGLILDPETGTCHPPVYESHGIFKCPQGQEFNTNLKMCVVNFVNLTTPVVANVMYEGTHFLNCTLDLGNQSLAGVQFRVAWYKRIDDTMQIIRRNMMGRLSLLKLYDDVLPGDMIQCAVIMSNTKQSIEEREKMSSPFFLGLKFSADLVQLREHFPTDSVTLYSTIPLLCEDSQLNCSLEVSFAVLSLDGRPSTRVRISTCSLTLHNDDCEIDVCSKTEVNFRLLSDFAFHEDNAGAILTVIINSGSDRWKQTSAELMIQVEDRVFRECYIFADPHIQTFDGRLLDITSYGTYVMFSTTYENFMVHVRVWNCSGEGGYCVCGVAVSYKNDHIIMDMCSTGSLEVKTRSLSSENFVIKEALEGRIKYVQFSSGSRLKISTDQWGMSVALMVPGRPATQTPGFCGNLVVDDESRDNFIRRSILNDGNSTYAYANKWRLKKYKTLFENLGDMSWKEPFSAECDCSPAFEGMQCNHNSVLGKTVLSVFDLRDTTNDYSNDFQNDGSGDGDQIYSFDKFEFDETQLSDEADGTRLFDEAKSDDKLIRRNSYIDDDYEQSGVGISDRDYEDVNIDDEDFGNLLSLAWQRERLMPEEDAQFLCSKAIVETPIAATCTSIVPKSIDASLNLCLRDIQIKQDSSRVKHDVKLIEDMCENNVLRKVTEYKDTYIFPDDILKSLACPSGCNEHGECTIRGCICETDYGGLDCSIYYTTTPPPTTTTITTTTVASTTTATTTTTAPKTDFFTFHTDSLLTNLSYSSSETTTASIVEETFEREDIDPLERPKETFQRIIQTTPFSVVKYNKTFELCDINKFDCRKVVFYARKANPRFQCKLTPVKITAGLTKFSNASMLIGFDINQKQFDCFLPPSEFLDRAFADMAPVDSVQIEMLNGRKNVVASRIFVIHDSRCQICTEDSGCRTKESTCYIDGKCQYANSRNPLNICQQCLPQVSMETWTGLEDNLPPVFDVANKQVVRFLHEDIKVLIRVFDPEGDKVTLSVDHPEAYVDEDSMLVWNKSGISRKDTPKLELFKVLAVDPCNYTSELLIQIIVVSCNCLHNGTCDSGFDSISGPFEYTCTCPPGYTGKLCETDINECEPNPCQHGVCVDYIQAYECVCPKGYKGEHCEISTDQCNENPCYPGVLCLSSPGSFQCSSCPPGLTGDGINCTETDSCLSSPCFPGTACKDHPAPANGFTCGKCPRFFIGDGVDCKKSDVLACSENVCSDLVECIEQNTYPGYTCGPCPEGYSGNGTTCTPICKPGCRTFEICAEPNVCRCPDGYSGSRCNKPICDPPCHKGGLCSAPNNCSCFVGYSGVLCEKSSCYPKCKNNGTCYSANRCRCISGFAGSRCDRVACNFLCQNGGRCSGPNKCKCRPLFYGFFCERKKCHPSCLNGGRCGQNGRCRCPYGYYGKRCQNAICNPPCLHGGRCKRKNTCKCIYGYTGSRCETAVCREGCANKGKCKSPDRCSCRYGWTGRRCDKAVCNLSCKNGGHCFKPNICVCKEGWTGADCSRAVCNPKCKNRGRCLAPNYCWCRRKFYGEECQLSLKVR